VLAYLTATGRIPREQTEAYLLRLYDTLQPRQESFVWSGWVLAIALLGLEGLSWASSCGVEGSVRNPSTPGGWYGR